MEHAGEFVDALLSEGFAEQRIFCFAALGKELLLLETRFSFDAFTSARTILVEVVKRTHELCLSSAEHLLSIPALEEDFPDRLYEFLDRAMAGLKDLWSLSLNLCAGYKQKVFFKTIGLWTANMLIQAASIVSTYADKKISFGLRLSDLVDAHGRTHEEPPSSDRSDQGNRFSWKNVILSIRLCHTIEVFASKLVALQDEMLQSLRSFIASRGTEGHSALAKTISALGEIVDFKALQLLCDSLGATSSENLLGVAKELENLRATSKHQTVLVFFLPLQKELDEVPLLRQWTEKPMGDASSTQALASYSVPPSDFVRKACDHYINFIHKLDIEEIQDMSSREPIYSGLLSATKVELQSGIAVAEESVELTHYWIWTVGAFLLKAIAHQSMRIQEVSVVGARQLQCDLTYVAKLCGKFIAHDPGLFSYYDSAILALSL